VDVQNYEGISKLSAIPNTFERIITSHLQHLCSSLILPSQHGFVKRGSTTTILLELTSFVIDGLNKKLQTYFDSVNHSLLLFKLDQLGFPNNLLTWISSYLNGGSQRVTFKNAVSKMIYVTSGVPPRSHLGPLLFTLFINDLPSIVTHSRVLVYAEDVKLCLSYNNIESGFCLQSDINRFQEWCQYKLLNLNYLKWNVMTFYKGTPTVMSYSLQNLSLDRIYSVKESGVVLDPKLKFDSHTNLTHISVLGFIKRWS